MVNKVRQNKKRHFILVNFAHRIISSSGHLLSFPVASLGARDIVIFELV